MPARWLHRFDLRPATSLADRIRPRLRDACRAPNSTRVRWRRSKFPLVCSSRGLTGARRHALRACRIDWQLRGPVCGIGDLRRWVEHATSHRVRGGFSGIRCIIAWPAGDTQLRGRPRESCNSRAGLTAAGLDAMARRALAPCDAGRSRSGDCPSAHAADCQAGRSQPHLHTKQRSLWHANFARRGIAVP